MRRRAQQTSPNKGRRHMAGWSGWPPPPTDQLAKATLSWSCPNEAGGGLFHVPKWATPCPDPCLS